MCTDEGSLILRFNYADNNQRPFLVMVYPLYFTAHSITVILQEVECLPLVPLINNIITNLYQWIKSVHPHKLYNVHARVETVQEVKSPELQNTWIDMLQKWISKGYTNPALGAGVDIWKSVKPNEVVKKMYAVYIRIDRNGHIDRSLKVVNMGQGSSQNNNNVGGSKGGSAYKKLVKDTPILMRGRSFARN